MGWPDSRQALFRAVHGHAGPGVRDGHAQARADDLRNDGDLCAFFLRADAVFDRILHQRLEQHGGQLRSCRLGFDTECGAQAFFEPHLLDAEIKLQRFHFLRHRNLAARLSDQRVPQEAGQPGEHGVGGLALLEEHQRTDRIERVEEEVRIELIAQHRKLRAGCLRFQPFEPVGLFFDLKEEIDREIQCGPGAEQGEVDEVDADEQADEIAAARGTARHIEYPAVDESVQGDGEG